MALTQELGPFFAPGGLQAAASTLADVGVISDAFRSGRGVAWSEHHPELTEGTLRFFRPNYIANLTRYWLPALDGVKDRLRAGTMVADIACGGGASTIVMAQAFPASSFVGFDSDERSIAWRAPRRSPPASKTAAGSRWPRPRTTRGAATGS